MQSDRRIDILRQIGELGSISKAARAVGVSYKAAWQAVDTLTNLSGVALLDRAVGGRGGGGARLTEAGQQLLVAAQALKSARTQAVQQVQGSDGDQHVATAARLAVRTSMRNQWPCVVSDMDVQGQIVMVRLHAVASEAFHVRARITRESAELLGLRRGIVVQALCKATAVHAQSLAPGENPDAENCWSGSVTRISRGALGDEVSARLGGGLQIVGFSDPGAGMKARSRVMLRVDDSAVVLALH